MGPAAVTNAAGAGSALPTGRAVPGWTPRPRPGRGTFFGRYCRLEPLDPDRHAADLWAAHCEDRDPTGWTYLPYGPFPSRAAYEAWMADAAQAEHTHFYAVVPIDDERSRPRAAGVTSYLRIDPSVGSIEVGHLRYFARLQRSPAATEAMYLMMARVFDDLRYRRYEWKCDALNAASRRAADRLGFTYEGTFRQATIYKGRNRDTAWYSVIDTEWPALRGAFERWLSPDNFDPDGRQRTRLAALRD